jgi:hypothetical protein
MSRKLVLVIAAIALLASTGIAVAAGTPAWWGNPGGLYPSWQHKDTAGTVANTGAQTQLITVIFDVPNVCPPNAASKDVWEQIEWTVNSGTASLSTGIRTIAWGPTSCPTSTSDPYTEDDSGNLTERGAFAPAHDYANGAERSRTITSSSPGWSPKCERIFTSFQVEPSSSLNYRLEVQSVCKGPLAVSLRDLSARSGAALPMLPTLGAISVLAFAPVVILARRRRSSR